MDIEDGSQASQAAASNDPTLVAALRRKNGVLPELGGFILYNGTLQLPEHRFLAIACDHLETLPPDVIAESRYKNSLRKEEVRLVRAKMGPDDTRTEEERVIRACVFARFGSGTNDVILKSDYF